MITVGSVAIYTRSAPLQRLPTKTALWVLFSVYRIHGGLTIRGNLNITNHCKGNLNCKCHPENIESFFTFNAQKRGKDEKSRLNGILYRAPSSLPLFREYHQKPSFPPSLIKFPGEIFFHP